MRSYNLDRPTDSLHDKMKREIEKRGRRGWRKQGERNEQEGRGGKGSLREGMAAEWRGREGNERQGGARKR